MKVDPQRAALSSKIDKVWPPPIPFKKAEKKKKAKEDQDDDEGKSKYRSFELYLEPTQADSDKYSRKIKVFDEGSAEEWVEHRMEVEDLFVAGGYESGEQQTQIYRALLEGKSKDIFRHYFNKRTVENGEKPEGERMELYDLLQVVLNDITRKVFGNQWARAARTQKGYLRKNLTMDNMNPEHFYERLKKINSYIPYFPYRDGHPKPSELAADEIVDIIDSAKSIDWHIIMLSQGKRPEEFESADELIEYLKQLYAADKISRAVNGENGKKRKSETDESSNKRRKGNKRMVVAESLALIVTRFTRRRRTIAGTILPIKASRMTRIKRRVSPTSGSTSSLLTGSQSRQKQNPRPVVLTVNLSSSRMLEAIPKQRQQVSSKATSCS